jgi:sarcosine oxidase
VAEALASRGAAHEWLSPAEAASRWPGLRFDERVLYQPDAGCCRADDTVRALQQRAAAHGAQLKFGVRATCRAVGDGVEVDAGDDTYEAKVAILAAGSWSSRVLPPPGTAMLPPMRVTQEQVFHFRPRPDAGEWPSFIHHRAPWRYGLLTPGEGVKVAEHGSGPETDPDQRSFAVDPDGRRRVCEYVADWLPGVEPVPTSETTCLYTTTPTEDFVVDRVPGAPLVVAAGFSGHGFKFTPLIGRMLADLAEGRPGAGHPRFALTGSVPA